MKSAIRRFLQGAAGTDALSRKIEELQARVEALRLCGEATEKDRQLYTVPTGDLDAIWRTLAAHADRNDAHVLEIGSREVVSTSTLRQALPLAQYTGFDVHAGPNVDTVGDAHELSSHFEPGRFDVVYSTAVFEHLAMPWIVAEEIAKVLRVGGYAFINTHFSYSEHELPWHFFQFNEAGLQALFNPAMGFETVQSGKGLPMVGRFAYDCGPDAGKPIAHLYCSSYLCTRKVAETPAGFDWRQALRAIYANTEYPRATPSA